MRYKLKKDLTFLALILLAATTTFGAGANDILGTWKTERDESQVEVFRCGEKICGRIVWLKKPIYTDRKDGEVGAPVIDRYNSDPTLRKCIDFFVFFVP